MKKIYSLFFVLFTLLQVSSTAQTWLPLGNMTPYPKGTYSLNDKAYTLFADTVTDYLFTSGRFDTAGTVQAKGLAVWNGTTWAQRGADQSSLNAFCWYNGDIYAGGQFTDNGNLIYGLAKWFASGWIKVAEIDGNISALEVYNGDLYVAGEFDAIGGVVSKNIAKYNGANWTAIPAGISGSDVIADLLVHNNELYIAGSKELAKWDGNTVTDIHFNLGSKCYALAEYQGAVHVAGGGGVARFTGSSWNIIGGGTDKDVFDLKVFSGCLYAAGQFGTINSQTIKKIAKWDGNAWSATGNLSDAFSLAVYKNQLYAVGDFGAAKLNAYSGMFETEEDQLGTVFPNPSKGKIRVGFFNKNEDVKVSVQDITGREIISGKNLNEIDLSSGAKGCYLVRLQSGAQVQSHKIVIE